MLYRFYTPAWEALQVSATPPQPRVSFEASSRQLGQAFVAAAAATTTAAATASSQLYNNMPSTAAHQGSTTSLSGQASSQQQHPAAAKPVSLQPAPQPHSMQGQLHTDRSFYAFEMGGVHFLMLDTESPSEPGSPQGIFVATDLAKVCVVRSDGILERMTCWPELLFVMCMFAAPYAHWAAEGTCNQSNNFGDL